MGSQCVLCAWAPGRRLPFQFEKLVSELQLTIHSSLKCDMYIGLKENSTEMRKVLRRGQQSRVRIVKSCCETNVFRRGAYQQENYVIKNRQGKQGFFGQGKASGATSGQKCLEKICYRSIKTFDRAGEYGCLLVNTALFLFSWAIFC